MGLASAALTAFVLLTALPACHEADRGRGADADVAADDDLAQTTAADATTDATGDDDATVDAGDTGTDATTSDDGSAEADADIVDDTSDADADIVDDADTSGDGTDTVEPGDTSTGDDATVAPDAETCTPAGPTWSRRLPRVGGIVVFDELAPADDAGLAWVELHSLMALSSDLSGWSLSGDIDFTFPEGTFIPADGRLVVAADPARLASEAGVVDALGPWSGALPADAHVELRSQTGRLMDLVAADDGAPWPTPADGHTLVKADPETASTAFESWRASLASGGTPGAAEPSRDAPLTLVRRDASWRYDASGALPADWPTPDDGLWAEGPAPFSDAGGATGTATLRATADNHFAVYLGATDGSDLRLVGRDTSGDWTSVETFALSPHADDRLFVAGWEGPGDSGSPQMLIAAVDRPDGSALGTGADTFECALGPPGANPGDALTAAAPAVAKVAARIAEADLAGAFAAPGAVLPSDSAPWGGAVGGAFSSASFIWWDTFDPASATNIQETYALCRSRATVVPPAGTVIAPVTVATAFVARFAFDGDPDAVRLALTLVADDGAAAWLNGVEVFRENLPSGPLTATTLALGPRLASAPPTRASLPTDALVVGDNVLAIEVHQAAVDDATLRFEAELTAVPRDSTSARPAPASASAVVLSELMVHPVAASDAAAGATPSDWIELANRGSEPVDLSGWQLVDAVEHTFAAGTVLAPGATLVLASDAAAFAAEHPDVPVGGGFKGGLASSGERVALLDACGRVADEVRYSDGGRWPEDADGGGSSLEKIDLWADGRSPESWAASDESGRATWQEIRYRGVAAPSAVGPDGQWEELVVGLLDAGVVLVDDLHVVEDPDGQKVELVQNPGFDGDSLEHWRALGTHAESRVVRDPDDDANSVLRLVATGPTEHMHNQLATTLAGGRRVTNGKTYEISYRARWVSGSDRLLTRLYFNRLARATRLARPGAGGTPGRTNSRAVDDAGPTFDGFAHAPIVPGAGEPVVVSVTADDPDGVADVTLWSAVDDSPPTATPMTLVGDGRWEATLEGKAQGAIVQMWVDGRDARGVHATFPARGPDSRALYRVDAPRTASSPGGRLHGLRIIMSPSDDRAFHATTNVMSNASTRVTVVSDERRVFYDVGVRAKGSERARDQQARLGWSIRFDPDRPLRGALATVSVDRSEGVISGVREILMDLAMAHAGSFSAEYNDLVWVVAPHAEHTGPAILQTMRFSDDMLDAQIPQGGDGLMYEYELVYFPYTTDDGTAEGLKLPEPDGVIGTGLGDLGPDPESYRWSFLQKNHRGDDSWTGLMAMLATWSLGASEFAARVSAVLDVDEWLRAFAFMSLSGAIDHYGGGAQHNAQLYLRPGDGRALLFPHDLDFYPGDPRSPIVQSGDLQRLLGLPGMRRRFYAALAEVLASTFNDGYLRRWRDELATLVPSEPFASHHQFMVDRAEWVRSGASDAVTRAYPVVPFAITTNGGADLQAPVGTVTLDGTGWLDVAAITWSGAPVAITWTDDSHWRVSRALAAGSYAVTLEARDAHGAIVGSDAVGIVVGP